MLNINRNINLAIPLVRGERAGLPGCTSLLDYIAESFDEATQTWASTKGNPTATIVGGGAVATKDKFNRLVINIPTTSYVEVSGSLPNGMYVACPLSSSVIMTGAGTGGYNWDIRVTSGTSYYYNFAAQHKPSSFTGNVAEQLVGYRYTTPVLGKAVLSGYMSGVNWWVMPCLSSADANTYNDYRASSGNGGFGSNFRIAYHSDVSSPYFRLRSFGYGTPTTAQQDEYNCRYGSTTGFIGPCQS